MHFVINTHEGYVQQRALDVIHREPRMLPGEEKVKGIEETGGRCRKGPWWALPTLSSEMLGGWKERMCCWVGYALQTIFPVAPLCPALCDLMHCRPPCPSPTPRVYSNSCPLSQWYHPTISFSVVPFSSHFQSFSTSGSFKMSQFFSSCGQSIGVSASASVLLVNIQDWFTLGWTGWISL